MTVFKEREIWTFRLSYIDPDNPNAAEVNLAGDDDLIWIAHTSGGRRCFTFYSYYCDTYGIDLDYLLGSVREFGPNCTMKLGNGYKAQIFYQYSRYKITDTVPPGVNVWEPPTTSATATRLAVPGKQIFISHFVLAPGEDAEAERV